MGRWSAGWVARPAGRRNGKVTAAFKNAAYEAAVDRHVHLIVGGRQWCNQVAACGGTRSIWEHDTLKGSPETRTIVRIPCKGDS